MSSLIPEIKINEGRPIYLTKVLNNFILSSKCLFKVIYSYYNGIKMFFRNILCITQEDKNENSTMLWRF